jgi:murein DD-endopeptidase MepM/ murein hydrolase activator NlpD
MSRLYPAALLTAVAAGCAAREAPASARRADVNLRVEIETVEGVVPRHATLASVLRDQGVSEPVIGAAVAATRAVFDPRRLRADRTYRLVRSVDGPLREFQYEIDADRFLHIAPRSLAQSQLLDAEVVAYKKETSPAAIHGRIDADHPSVIAAMDETGETIALALSLAGMFAGQIDFDSDLQQGDSFDVLFEKSAHDGRFAGYGPIIAARFTAGGRQIQAFRWSDPATSRAAFYDENGRSLKRFFLRSPLRFEPRITSGFSRSRLHPIYRTYRPHLGVDYAAPAGSPVVAVASGTVVSAGWSGGGGNMVRIRHASGFESYYLHLSAFGKGIRSGVRVDQGQLIGRVGATGAATGPHLDYRLRKNGVFVDPLAEHRKLPPGEPIPRASLALYRATRDESLRRLSALLTAERPPRPQAVTAAR